MIWHKVGSLPLSHKMAYRARECRRPKHHYCFSYTCVWSNFAHFFLNSSIHFISTMTSNLNLVIETPETVTGADIHGTLDEQPFKTHKSKKHVKDHNKAGRASMVPPSLDPPSKRARHDFAEGAPQNVPRRNTLCTSTSLGENQRPSSRSIDQGDDWRVNDGTYDGAYDGAYDDSYDDSWHREPRRCVMPYYEGSQFEDNASIPYGYQPSSPYRYSLYGLPGVSASCSKMRLRMSTPFRTSSDASLTK
jgi:hypothetical protein